MNPNETRDIQPQPTVETPEVPLDTVNTGAGKAPLGMSDRDTRESRATPTLVDQETREVPASPTLADEPAEPPTPNEDRVFAAFPWLLLAALVAATAVVLAANWAPAIFTPDANGYWAQGSRLAENGRTWFTAEAPVEYVGGHWLMLPDGRYVSRYPPGLAVLIAAAWKIGGADAAVAVNPLLGLLTVIGVFLLCRRIVGNWWALAGALILATNPVFIRHSLTCDSHIAVTMLLTCGLWLLLRWGQKGHWLNVAGAGLLLGAIPTVRYPEALFALAIGIYLLYHYRSRPHIWAHYVAALAGALVPVTVLAIRNHLLFGAFWRTGYALTGEQTGFGWQYFRQHAIQYLQFINSDGMGPLLILGLAGLGLLWWQRRLRPLAALLTALILPTTLLYMAYYWAPARMAQGTMRFLLPLLPAAILTALYATKRLTRTLPSGPRITVVAMLLLLQMLWGVPTLWSDANRIHWQKAALTRVSRGLNAVTRDGAVVIAHPGILQHLDYLQRWRLADMTLMRAGMPRGRDADGADTDEAQEPKPMQDAKRAARNERYRDLRPMERERALTEDIREWAGDSTIWYVGTETEITEFRGAWFHPENFEIVTRIPLPPRRDQQQNEIPGRDRRRQPTPRNRRDWTGGDDELVVARWVPQWRRPTWVEGLGGRQRSGGFGDGNRPPPGGGPMDGGPPPL